MASVDYDDGSEMETNRSAPLSVTPDSEEKLSHLDRLLRPVSETKAMASSARWWKKMLAFLHCKRREKNETPSFQYRIPPPEEKQSMILSWRMAQEEMFVSITRFFSRANISVLLLSFIGIYFAFIFAFSFFIHLVVILYDNAGVICVSAYDYERSNFSADFLRSFDLSWTTFSTVGYGVASPPADETCLGLRYLLAVEAFNGILFAGFCGGLFFLKISRLHTRAYATFSSCMCLQFGTKGTSEAYYLRVETRERRASAAVQASRHHLAMNDESKETESDTTPFPVLIFRLINSRATMGGEIVDASIKCMAVSLKSEDHDVADSDWISIEGEQVNNGIDSSSRRDSLVRKKVYCKLQVAPDVNPFFSNGVWYVRHVMNDKSALLKVSVRQRIVETGSWPSDINTYSKIRDSLADEVQEIVVTFNGTSNVTADEVFKTVTFKPDDIFIGWQFAQMYYLQQDGMSSSNLDLRVDGDLLNDIVPQESEGGSEPLGNYTDEGR